MEGGCGGTTSIAESQIGTFEQLPDPSHTHFHSHADSAVEALRVTINARMKTFAIFKPPESSVVNRAGRSQELEDPSRLIGCRAVSLLCASGSNLSPRELACLNLEVISDSI